MSKVIRVADEVFTRLQRLAEPFVDTLSDVIEHLLDEHDSRHEGTDLDSSVPDESETCDVQEEAQLYLVPATRENARETLAGTVDLGTAAQRLEAAQVDELEKALGNREPFRCRAMTENSRSFWEAMTPGDIVLFTLKGTGRFDYMATVTTKIENQRLGDALWPIVPGEPWSLIYVLEDVIRISIDKTRLVTSLGMSRNYFVPGTIRVDPDRLWAAIDKYGSLEGLVAALDNRSD